MQLGHLLFVGAEKRLSHCGGFGKTAKGVTEKIEIMRELRTSGAKPECKI
jgi:hypothetical protein